VFVVCYYHFTLTTVLYLCFGIYNVTFFPWLFHLVTVHVGHTTRLSFLLIYGVTVEDAMEEPASEDPIPIPIPPPLLPMTLVGFM
jgi:hypothetical protein